MEHRNRTGLFALVIVGVAVAAGAAFFAGKASNVAPPAPQQAGLAKEDIGPLVREYLLANPELVEEVQQALQAKRDEESQKLALAAIEENHDAIFNAPEDMVLGNPDGDITLVEFFDYNCGFCKRAMEDVVKIMETDSNVRVVLKEFPILGPDSLAAHQVSMAFRKLAPEKYGEYHMALLGADVRATEALAIELAKNFGVDEEALRAGMADPAIGDSIRQAYTLADALGISGTPSFVLGDETVFGAVGSDTLLAKIDNMRQCQSTVC
jgi:protein-disulfide isomerase